MDADSGLTNARASLARQEASLVRALVGALEPVAGFDHGDLEATRRSLLHKRAREAAKAWPELARHLGDRYEPTFVAYADANAPPSGGARADGFGFAHHLDRLRLSQAARLELAEARAQWSVRAGSVRPRRVGLGATTLHRPRGIFVALRAPGLGSRRLKWRL